MKNLILMAGILLCSHPAHAIAFSKSCSNTNQTGTSISSLSCSAAIAVASGDAIQVTCRSSSAQTSPTVTDTGSANTFVKNNGGTSGMILNQFVVASANAVASDTITCNFSPSSAFDSIVVTTYTGASGGVDANATAAGCTSSCSSTIVGPTGSFTTAQASEVIVVCGSYTGTAKVWSASTIGGVTAALRQTSGSSSAGDTACEDLIVSSIQTSITGSLTHATVTGTEWTALAVSFKGSAAAENNCTLKLMGAGPC